MERWSAGVGLLACGGRRKLGLVVGTAMEVDVGVDGGLGDKFVEVGAGVEDAWTVAHEFGAEFLVAPGGEGPHGGEDGESGIVGAVEVRGFEGRRRLCIRRLEVGLDRAVEVVPAVEDAGTGADERRAFEVASPHGHGFDGGEALEGGVVRAVKAAWFEGRWLLRQGHGGSFCWSVWNGFAIGECSPMAMDERDKEYIANVQLRSQ